jgi:hypothetical protein
VSHVYSQEKSSIKEVDGSFVSLVDSEVGSLDEFSSLWVEKFQGSSRFVEIELSKEVFDQDVEKVQSWARFLLVWVLDVGHVNNSFDGDCYIVVHTVNSSLVFLGILKFWLLRSVHGEA